ncbi:hypothetical protein CF336_g9529 [Tilletia laevis]|nr:hypothetical protein CF336_g9529 [Tilletia laevis]
MADVPEVQTFPIPARLQGQGRGQPQASPLPQFHIDKSTYEKNCAASLADPDRFWGDLARETTSWDVRTSPSRRTINNHKEITFGELLKQVSQAANVLKKLGVKKGDAVII